MQTILRAASAIQHATVYEINTGSSQLIQTLVCQQHLTKSFKVVWVMPRLLHSLNVFGLYNG